MPPAAAQKHSMFVASLSHAERGAWTSAAQVYTEIAKSRRRLAQHSKLTGSAI